MNTLNELLDLINDLELEIPKLFFYNTNTKDYTKDMLEQDLVNCYEVIENYYLGVKNGEFR